MARTSLQDVLSLGDVAQTWNFDIFFPYLPGSASSRDLTFRCMTTDLPGTQLEVVEAPLHGVVIPYAGRRMFTQTMNVTFLETFDWGTREKFRRWIAIARDWRTNSGSFFATYAIGGVQLVTYNDIPQPVNVTQLNYVWPTEMQEVALDGGQSGLVQLTVVFKYVDWETI